MKAKDKKDRFKEAFLWGILDTVAFLASLMLWLRFAGYTLIKLLHDLLLIAVEIDPCNCGPVENFTAWILLLLILLMIFTIINYFWKGFVRFLTKR